MGVYHVVGPLSASSNTEIKVVKIKKAVIAAGGLGDGFLPLTKSQPKEIDATSE